MTDPNRPDQQRADQREQLRFRTYTTLAAALRNAPEPVGRAVAAIVGEVMALKKGETQDLATAHLRRVLSQSSNATDTALDPVALRRLTRRAYRAYARYWVEGARLPALSRDLVCSRMLVDGFENLKEAMDAGQGVVMALPHVGSWEWGGSWLHAVGYPMISVAERLEPPELFDWFIEQRKAMGLEILPLDASSALVLKALRSGRLVGLLCDRDLLGNGVEVEFFGERTTMPAGPATLALRSGAALLPTVVYSGPGLYHTAVISPPLDTTRQASLRKDVARVTQEIATCFEHFVRRAPEQWHLFQPNWPSEREGRPPGPPASAARPSGAPAKGD
jgi:phosphatidylinositol dimannoside acyltransferase